MKYNIHKPWETLDPWQKKYIETEGNCFLLCGRQSGKTAAASIKFGTRAVKNENHVILMLAFTERQAYALFFKTLMFLEAKYPKMIKRGADKPTKHIIKLKNGSIIMCYAVGLTGEGIRTYTINSLVVDEAAPMAREVFIAITPMLSVTGGSMDLLSTPRGAEGYFYDCSDQCPNVKENFSRFYISAEDCPRHEKDFLKSEKATMSELEYAQEYLARFLDEIRQFYPNKLISACQSVERRPLILHGKDYYLGVDVAHLGADDTTFEILDIIERDKVVHVESIVEKKLRTTETAKKIIELELCYDFKKINVDGRGVGAGVVDQLLEDDDTKRKVVNIDNAAKSLSMDDKEKRRLLGADLHFNLRSMMERGDIKLLKDKEIALSLASVQFEESEGKIKFFGKDTHIAEALKRAAWGVKQKGLNPYFIF